MHKMRYGGDWGYEHEHMILARKMRQRRKANGEIGPIQFLQTPHTSGSPELKLQVASDEDRENSSNESCQRKSNECRTGPCNREHSLDKRRLNHKITSKPFFPGRY